MRISYYRPVGRWDFPPSQHVGPRAAAGTPVGRPVGPDTINGCFACHTTALVLDGARVDPARSIFGVGCESCHGPGRDHVAAAKRRERDLRMADLSTARDRVSLELCGEC